MPPRLRRSARRRQRAQRSGPEAAVAGAFLVAIDGDELERAALSPPDLGTGPGSLTEAILIPAYDLGGCSVMIGQSL